MKLLRSPQVVSTDIGAGVALLHLTSNTYFSLNEVGAFLWSLLEAPKSREDLVAAVVKEYDVSADLCGGDVDQVLSDLREAALVVDEHQRAQ